MRKYIGSQYDYDYEKWGIGRPIRNQPFEFDVSSIPGYRLEIRDNIFIHNFDFDVETHPSDHHKLITIKPGTLFLIQEELTPDGLYIQGVLIREDIVSGERPPQLLRKVPENLNFIWRFFRWLFK